MDLFYSGNITETFGEFLFNATQCHLYDYQPLKTLEKTPTSAIRIFDQQPNLQSRKSGMNRHHYFCSPKPQKRCRQLRRHAPGEIQNSGCGSGVSNCAGKADEAQ
jgi:hypothetical protein